MSLLLCLSLAIGFSGVSIKVSADTVPSGGHYLTVQETRDFIGSTIPFTYYNGSQYVDAVATYHSSVQCTSETSENPSGFPVGATFLQYNFQANGINSSPNYITFRITPTYSIFDTEFLYTCFGVTKYTAQNVSSSAYQSPNSDWFIGGSNVNFANHNETSTNSGSYAYLNFNTLTALYVPIVHRSQSTFSAYAVDFEASGGVASSGAFYVMCPYVSGDAFGQSGTFASSSSGSAPVTTSAGSGSANVDLSETNGILGTIAAGISGIADTLVHVFVPTEEQILDFRNDLDELLDDTFTGIPETNDILDDVKDTIVDAPPVSQITFPAIAVPNTSFTIAQRTVNLVPMPDLLDFIKLGFDILATCAFINLIRKKFDEIIHGKVIVESEDVSIS